MDLPRLEPGAGVAVGVEPFGKAVEVGAGVWVGVEDWVHFGVIAVVEVGRAELSEVLLWAGAEGEAAKEVLFVHWRVAVGVGVPLADFCSGYRVSFGSRREPQYFISSP